MEHTMCISVSMLQSVETLTDTDVSENVSALATSMALAVYES